MKIQLLIIALSLACCNTTTAQTDTKNTKWTPNTKYIAKGKTDSLKTKESFQCWGTCKTGKRCNRKVNTYHDFCYQHKEQK